MLPVIGVNIPWFNQGYGHDLGWNQAYPGWPTFFDVEQARRLLTLLSDLGIRLLRIWLFEDGEGLMYEQCGALVGIDAAFRHNLADLVELLDAFGFRVYWTLLDANSVKRRNDRITSSILRDVKQTERFCGELVREVFPIIRESAWAVDLCNEPEALVAGDHGNKTGLGFDWWEIRPALEVLRKEVAAGLQGVPISVGSGYQEHRAVTSPIYGYSSFGLDFLDFHTHGSDGLVVHADGLALNQAAVLGELGVGVPLEVNHSRETWILGQERLMTSLLHVASHGYQAAFLWYVSDLGQYDAAGLVYLNEPGLVLRSLLALEDRGVVHLTPARRLLP